MAIKVNVTAKSSFFALSFLFLLSLFLCIHLFFSSTATVNQSDPVRQHALLFPPESIRVFVADLPRSLNYGLLQQYWSSDHPDSRIPSDPDHQIPNARVPKFGRYPPYPGNTLIKQYSAEYWIMGDLETPADMRTGSFAKRVFDVNEADVVFVPFFATLSAEMELARGAGSFRKKFGNEDYRRQKLAVDLVKNTDPWKRSGGRDHVFVLTGYVKKLEAFFGRPSCNVAC